MGKTREPPAEVDHLYWSGTARQSGVRRFLASCTVVVAFLALSPGVSPRGRSVCVGEVDVKAGHAVGGVFDLAKVLLVLWGRRSLGLARGL
jgi:hypothetical protein